MRRAGFAFAPLFLAAMVIPAVAQEKIDIDPKNTETVKVTVSGGVTLDWVWRDRTLTAARGPFGFYGVDPGESGRTEGVVEAQASIRLDVDLSEKVRLAIQIDNKRFEGSSGVDALGTNPEGLPIFVRELNFRFFEVFHKAIEVTAGVQPWTFDVRGTGHAFFWDPSNSGSFTRNAGSGIGGGTGTASGVRDQLQPVGVVGSWTTEQFRATLALLPAIIEGGSTQHDEAAYLASAIYELNSIGRGSRVGAIAALHTLNFGSGSFSDLLTFGVEGVVRHLWIEGLEVYNATYIQAGQIGTVVGTSDSVKADGWAFELGARYTEGDSSWPWWVEVKFTYLSGDRDQGTGNTRVDAFLSYENVDDLLILEDDFFGFDWDTNLRALKFMAGVNIIEEKLEIGIVFGFCQSATDVTFASGDEKTLGKEIDVKATWSPHKQLTVEGGVALLVTADLLEKSLGGPADGDANDGAALFMVGARVRW